MDNYFIIDLPLLMGVESNGIHHTKARLIIDEFISSIINSHPDVEEFMRSVGEKQQDTMKFKLIGCALLRIINYCPPGCELPRISIVVYKAICRSLFDILTEVFGINTSAILGTMGSKSYNNVKINSLSNHFHIKHTDPGYKDIRAFFLRLLEGKCGVREEIINWIISVIYVCFMAPVFDRKYHGIFRAEKYYELYSIGAPVMHKRDHKTISLILLNVKKHIRTIPESKFAHENIIGSSKIPIDITTKVAFTLLENMRNKDLVLTRTPGRKKTWDQILGHFHKQVSPLVEPQTTSPVLYGKNIPINPNYIISICGGTVEPKEITDSVAHVDSTQQAEIIPPFFNNNLELRLGSNLAGEDVILGTSGDDFFIRDKEIFPISGDRMLRLLAVGHYIKDTISLNMVGSNIEINIGNQIIYTVPVYMIRGFVSVIYPSLNVRCKYDSQQWCYMKNGGTLCTHLHKYVDGRDLKL
jgi:hypothetical protein